MQKWKLRIIHHSELLNDPYKWCMAVAKYPPFKDDNKKTNQNVSVKKSLYGLY